MQFKLALKNVRKSFKDYTVYFLTIAFGVCLFYVFNSLDSQTTVIDLSKAQRSIYSTLTTLISGVSVFVSLILAFLILYANKFLIKRRKKELSLYMILGMEKSKISLVLVVETLLTGLMALAFGLVVGIFASQGLSVVVANMFKAEMSDFYFTFSVSALVKTIIYFGLIFILVMIFNIINITKCKLITLMQSQSKNETGKVRNLFLSIVIFIVSVVLLVIAYQKILENQFTKIDDGFAMSIIFGTIGTFLFFFSISGFLNVIIKKNKRIFYKRLNIFTFRQLTNKINTNCISMTLICLMLLLTIGVLACANGVNNAMSSTLEMANPQDATFMCSRRVKENPNPDGTITYSVYLEDKEQDFMTSAFYEDKRLDDIVKSKAIISVYLSGVDIRDYAVNIDNTVFKDAGIRTTAISLSDYNQIKKLRGEEEFTLQENEYAVLNNTHSTAEVFDIDNMPNIEINGKTLSYKGGELISDQIENMPIVSTSGVLVLNDEFLLEENIFTESVMVNYNSETDEEEFVKLCNEYAKAYDGEDYLCAISTKTTCFEASTGLSVIATFISLYIGIVFLITSCAILALQQLSESSDNMERYRLLRKLGASTKDINNALFKQILSYFAMPLSLAIIHSIVGVKSALLFIESLGDMNIAPVAVMTASTILLVYGGYFAVTYFCSRSIISSK